VPGNTEILVNTRDLIQRLNKGNDGNSICKFEKVALILGLVSSRMY